VIRDLSTFVCLMYHNVHRDAEPYAHYSPSVTSYFVNESTFTRHIREIGRFPCMSAADMSRFYSEEPVGLSDAGRVLLTFDDGWKDSIDVAGALLAQHRLPAMLFITTDFVGRRDFLSRQDLSRIDTATFTIGSHGRSHRMLNLLTARQIRRELLDSKKFLEDTTGREVTSLSVPSGAYTPRVRLIAVECGYRHMFTSDIHLNYRGASPMSIGRVAITRSTTDITLRRLLQQRLTPERTRRLVLSLPKRLLGLGRYERLRRKLLGEIPSQLLTHTS